MYQNAQFARALYPSALSPPRVSVGLIELEGGCAVTVLHGGEEETHGPLSVRALLGRDQGAELISLRALRCAPGLSPGWRNASGDEVLYVLNGTGELRLDSHRHPIGPGSCAHVAPGVRCAIDNLGTEPMIILSARCPEPTQRDTFGYAPETSWTPPPLPDPAPVVCLADAEATPPPHHEPRVTQSVSVIPPGRGRDHTRQHEEVWYVLEGTGRMWAGEQTTEIATGSCIFLPRGQAHRVESTGKSDLRLLGISCPAASDGDE